MPFSQLQPVRLWVQYGRGFERRGSGSPRKRRRPARRAFFYMRPPLCAPALDGRLVALSGLAFRLLTAPAFAAEDPPHMRGVIGDAEGPSDDRSDPG